MMNHKQTETFGGDMKHRTQKTKLYYKLWGNSLELRDLLERPQNILHLFSTEWIIMSFSFNIISSSKINSFKNKYMERYA